MRNLGNESKQRVEKKGRKMKRGIGRAVASVDSAITRNWEGGRACDKRWSQDGNLPEQRPPSFFFC
jgi:hypothetical protein